MIGVMTHVVDGHPDGISRVWIGGDPSRSMGAVAEAECRRILAAIDLAERLGVPLEWVAISAGARIAWDSGTENMDWCAAVVARLITFTQRGGQVVVVVSGINVGAQSYWNAEATMLGHHKGMLIMLPDQAMVLTGKRALALSGGGTHATDAHIGGYDEVMGPNGQAHHKAADDDRRLPDGVLPPLAVQPRRDEQAPVVASTDPLDRDITPDPYTEPEPFETVGDVLDKTTHPGRKQAFAMRLVMGAVVDRDAPVLERWTDMADARGTIVWDSRVGGSPVSVVGIEARPVKSDTGEHWLSASTLHPEGSRKVAKAINAASGNRPVVVLASLSGFDGSARSMKGRQLEFGAEIARAVTNFEGPIVVVVLGRFHGGAYVVFSKALNPNVRILALDGAFVSVIGGDAAAGVVFAGELKKREAAAMAEDPTPGPRPGASSRARRPGPQVRRGPRRAPGGRGRLDRRGHQRPRDPLRRRSADRGRCGRRTGPHGRLGGRPPAGTHRPDARHRDHDRRRHRVELRRGRGRRRALRLTPSLPGCVEEPPAHSPPSHSRRVRRAAVVRPDVIRTGRPGSRYV